MSTTLQLADLEPGDSKKIPPGICRPLERAALSDEGRRLVRENIGLVYVHLRHAAAKGQPQWTRREWEDLVQEGCLGLIRAAQDFNPQRNIPFAAFALPRVHTAVRRALLRWQKERSGGLDPLMAANAVMGSPSRRMCTAVEDPLESLGDWYGQDGDTVGLRLREKYDRAVHRAVDALCTEESSDANRRVIGALASERHLVPDLHARKPYRRIASELKIHYGRVTHFDRLLRAAIERVLSGDPEFLELQRLSRTAPYGVDTRSDDQLEQHLARLGAADVIQRLINGPRKSKDQVVSRLLELAPPSLFSALETELAKLPAVSRESLFACSQTPTNVSAM